MTTAELEPVWEADDVTACDGVAVRVSPPVTVCVDDGGCVADGDPLTELVALLLKVTDGVGDSVGDAVPEAVARLDNVWLLDGVSVFDPLAIWEADWLREGLSDADGVDRPELEPVCDIVIESVDDTD